MNRQDITVISDITTRAIDNGLNLHKDRMSLLMDIECAHDECNLRLDELLGAPEFDFAHDVLGIQRHMNRETKKLKDCFSPRYARGYDPIPV